jgi:hypothetical protein
MSPWERRERGGLYYYRSVRDGEHVRKEYIGTGPLAHIVAFKDTRERREREERAEAWQAELEDLWALDSLTEELCEAADLLTRAALLAVGYRQHHRGEWRKQRERNDARD